jgi:hypothetical protein
LPRGKFEDWLRDETSFALQAANPQLHVAREHENMDVVVFDPNADGITVWQWKHAYSINQWYSNPSASHMRSCRLLGALIRDGNFGSSPEEARRSIALA